MSDEEQGRKIHLVEIKEDFFKSIVPYIALFISIITAAVVVWQGFETRNHYRKIVSPHVVTYTTNTTFEEEWGIFLQNEGVGPALITLHKMTIDGSEKSPVSILNQMIEEKLIKNGHPAVRRLMGEELVLKAGSKTPILVFVPKGVNPGKIDEFEKLINERVNLQYSWCSVYGECQNSCTAFQCKK